MGWYRLTNAAGEPQYVSGLTGQNTSGCEVTAIARCPEPWEAVADDGTITADLVLKAQMEADAALNKLSKPDLFALAVLTARDQLIDDMATAGVITSQAAASMKEGA